MFLQSLVELNDSISCWNFAPNSGENQKKQKSICRILVLSQSRISDFLLPSGYYLPKNRGGQTYFAPFSVRPEGMLPPGPPKPTPMSISICFKNMNSQYFAIFLENSF